MDFTIPHTDLAITGYGLLTPVGENVQDSWSAIMAGRSGCGRITRFPSEAYPVTIAAEVPREFWKKPEHSSLAYTFGEKVLSEALSVAGICEQELGTDTALVVGVGGDDDAADQWLYYLDAMIAAAPDHDYKDLGTISKQYTRLLGRRISLESLASALAIRFGIQGEVLCVSTACASGAHAIALAADLLRAGSARRVAVLGTDAMINQVNLSNFCTLGVLSKRNNHPDVACRPFDTRRQGFVLGEGAGALILDSAQPDGSWRATPKGYLAGYGVSADAFSITDKESDGSGVLLAIEQAMKSADICPGDIAYINAHGTGTRKNDSGEAAAIRRAFGSQASQVPISSIKGQIGHTIAAAGAIEAIVTLLALNSGTAPGTSSLETISPDVSDLNILGPGVHPIKRGLGMSISAGFGGVNVCLILRSAEDCRQWNQL